MAAGKQNENSHTLALTPVLKDIVICHCDGILLQD